MRGPTDRIAARAAAVVTALLVLPASARAQPPAPLTFQAAMQYAVDHYPTVKAALEQVNASTAGVSVARSAYLPRLDALWQTNRATANNIFGQLLPQSVIPAMSGPVLASASGDSVWGSAAGALFSWEPFDFGLRQAAVEAAQAAVARARAGEAMTRLDVQRAVGTAFLAVVAAQRTVDAMQADLDRRDAVVRAVHALADNQLRPGADASRVDAERAAALTRLIQARQTLTLAQTTIARLLGVRAAAVTIDPAGVLDEPPASDSPAPAVQQHPLAQARQASVEAAHAQERILARTDLPRVYLQSSVFARGSGADPSGIFDGGASGLGLERANWAAGIQVQIPNLFDFSSLRARRTAAAASARAESALYDEALLSITSEQDAAAAMLEAARAVAANTPVQLAAARQTESQARARYNAGLAAIVEVAEAQSLLAQAEMQDALARIDVWRALLADAVARGSVTALVSRIPSSPGAR